jgi:3-hydroxymyristoyl/3-hydroxydecanoyl-(acyl carrier protein) dehydratase
VRRPACGDAFRPLPGVTLEVDGEERLWVTSPFLREPGRPALTGERGRLEPDGSFVHLGREDGVVKVGGKRTSLQELEQAALALPGVREAAALARATAGLRGVELWLAVAGEGLDRAAVRAGLAARVDPLFLPRRLRIVSALPRSERGKVTRAALVELFAPGGVELRVTARDARGLSAEVEVDRESRYFAGHFPGLPVLPGARLLTAVVLPLLARLTEGSLHRLERVRFRRPVTPGARVVVELALLEPSESALRVRFSVREASSGLGVAEGLLEVSGRARSA